MPDLPHGHGTGSGTSAMDEDARSASGSPLGSWWMATRVSRPSASRDASRATWAGARCDSTTTATVPLPAPAFPSPITSALYPRPRQVRSQNGGSAERRLSPGRGQPCHTLARPIYGVLRATSPVAIAAGGEERLSMSSSQQPGPVAAVDYTGVLRRRWWVVAACAVVGLLGAAAYLVVAPKTYTA